jgi:hypothetical protein
VSYCSCMASRIMRGPLCGMEPLGGTLAVNCRQPMPPAES